MRKKFAGFSQIKPANFFIPLAPIAHAYVFVRLWCQSKIQVEHTKSASLCMFVSFKARRDCILRYYSRAHATLAIVSLSLFWFVRASISIETRCRRAYFSARVRWNENYLESADAGKKFVKHSPSDGT